MMKALSHWRPYLGWTKEPFTIMTDHANLQYWKSPKNLNQRTACWHADLQEYDFDILYIPGKTKSLLILSHNSQVWTKGKKTIKQSTSHSPTCGKIQGCHYNHRNKDQCTTYQCGKKGNYESNA